ncbi:hypothetical protein CDO52_06440 [Nocardiopsis gilva YIM 90087]|uniref:Uncharacterized protein n=1 Tax=Nocardiopsis gilva YIM 90087 TaxID=1235441 RepID=A0A223S2X0_9ACTN|nr:hypothetical protein CDO52_06440 [Nocardiopsis gilva YIM 90087]
MGDRAGDGDGLGDGEAWGATSALLITRTPWLPQAAARITRTASALPPLTLHLHPRDRRCVK